VGGDFQFLSREVLVYRMDLVVVEAENHGHPVTGLDPERRHRATLVHGPRHRLKRGDGDDVVVQVGVTQKVTPVRECVTDRGNKANPRFRARFGYRNPAPFAIAVVTVPLVENTFTALPALRGQPQVFLSGTRTNVFGVDFQSGSVAWKLNGTTVTADSKSPRC